MVKDPACGKKVDAKSIPHVSNFSGTMYYFCSPGDKSKFARLYSVIFILRLLENEVKLLIDSFFVLLLDLFSAILYTKGD